LAAAGDIASAYVSSRRSDDRAVYRRVIVVVEGNEEPSYLIDAPTGTDVWIVVQPYGPESETILCGSLRDALNSIRPVLTNRKKGVTGDVLAAVTKPSRLPKRFGRSGRSKNVP
jgi:hypothetical protein